MKKRIVLIVIIWLAVIAIDSTCSRILFPVLSADFGVRQLEDSDEAWQEMQAFEWGKSKYRLVLFITGAGFTYLTMKPKKEKGIKCES